MTIVNNLNAAHRGVRIDRHSMWGNPFRMKNDSPEERARVCRKFRRWWYDDEQCALRKRARAELRNVTLLCHCTPQPCHGLTIATYVNWMWRLRP